MDRIKAVFFDLDDTLWDFRANAALILGDIYRNLGLCSLYGVAGEKRFVERFHLYNSMVWQDYREGKIDKEVLGYRRFEKLLGEFGIDDPEKISYSKSYFSGRLPYHSRLIKNAVTVLQAVSARYPLGIISNGFNQTQKLKSSGIIKYFKYIITSEETGVRKPDPRIFKKAVELASVSAQESIYVGDDYPVDIVGASRLGMKTVLFDRDRVGADYIDGCVPDYVIHDLLELVELLGIKKEGASL